MFKNLFGLFGAKTRANKAEIASGIARASCSPLSGERGVSVSVGVAAPNTRAEATSQIESLVRANKHALDALAKL